MSLQFIATFNENDAGNVYDYSTQGNVPTNVTSLIIGASDIGKKANFDGIRSEVIFGDILDFGNTSLMSFFVKFKVTAGLDHQIIHKSGQYQLSINTSNKVRFTVVTSVSTLTLDSIASIVDDTWITVGVAYNGAAQFMYFDGALDASQDHTGTLSASSSDVTIGSNSVTGSTFMTGDMEIISAYSQSLVLAEFKALHDKPGGFVTDFKDTSNFSNGDLLQLSAIGSTAGGQCVVTGDLGSNQLMVLPIFNDIPLAGSIIKHAGNVYDTARQCTHLQELVSGSPEMVMRDGVDNFTPDATTIRVKLSCSETILSSVEATGPVFFNNPITPAAFTTLTQHDWAPTNIGTTNMIRASSTNAAGTTLTGILAPSPVKNQVIFLTNVGTKTITLSTADAGSIAANRFKFFVNILIQENEGALLVYDQDMLRWKAIAINT